MQTTRRQVIRHTGAGLSALGLMGLPSRILAQAAPSWADPALVAAAKAEGGPLVVYSAINEQEGLPLFKVFEEATGIKFEYVRGSDVQLNSRVAIEARSNQRSWDIMSSTGVSRMPQDMLQPIEPPQAAGLIAAARDPGKRWYGHSANYNTPAYNTKAVKREDLPKSYEELAAKKEWAGRTAIDVADQQWLSGLCRHYGEEKGLRLVREMVASLKPTVIDGHLALARQVGLGEYSVALNNYLPLTLNVMLAGGATDFWIIDPVVLFFHQVGVNVRAPHPKTALLAANYLLSREAQTFAAKWGRTPTRSDVTPNPADLMQRLEGHKIVPVVMSSEEDRKWLKTYQDLVKPR